MVILWFEAIHHGVGGDGGVDPQAVDLPHRGSFIGDAGAIASLHSVKHRS